MLTKTTILTAICAATILIGGCAGGTPIPTPTAWNTSADLATPTAVTSSLSTETPTPAPTATIAAPVAKLTPVATKGRGDSSATSVATASSIATPAPAVSQPGPKENTYWVTNPTSRAKLFVQVIYPTKWDGKTPLPTLVLVPGGIGDGDQVVSQGRGQAMADGGYAIVAFDADGRGQSGGQEDYNGFIDQDGLAAVSQFATMIRGVDANRIGLVSLSYGTTMASGAPARHPEMPVRFLIDWEGPANRQDTTTGCQVGGRIAWHPCSDNAFWSEREAVSFIGRIRVPYQRIQSEQDHVQKDVGHAIDLVNAAISGGVPWVRLNEGSPNTKYDAASPPAMLPELLDKKRDEIVAKHAAYLFSR